MSLLPPTSLLDLAVIAIALAAGYVATQPVRVAIRVPVYVRKGR